MTTPRDSLYAGYRYPAELISHAVWLYFWFPLGLRMVEEMRRRAAASQHGALHVPRPRPGSALQAQPL